MKYKLNGINYNVNITGSGQALLLLHGFTGSLHIWDRFIPELSQHFTTIAVDLLGHGKTDAPLDPNRYAIERAATDIIELLDTLGIEKAHLLGYSMGGRLALLLAVRYPERFYSLILESSSPGIQNEEERLKRVQSDEELADFIEEKGIEAFIDYWEDIPLFQTQKRVRLEERKKLRHLRLQNRAHGLANSLRGMGTGRQPPLWEELSFITMPVFLIVGSFDTKYVQIAKQIAERVKHAKLNIVNDAGHTVHFEQSETFLELILNFLLQLKEEQS